MTEQMATTTETAAGPGRLEAIPLRRALTDLRELLASSLEALADQAARLDIEFRIHTTDEVPPAARIDPEKIAWAIATLAGNALRYTRPGTRLMPGGSIHVYLDYAPGTGEVILSVQDDGPGIPEDKVPWLFQRATGKTHAAGLGLKLIHDVVTAHGGSIDVDSRTEGFEHGTSITLRIPAR
ncbi:sensor histidine kinase [Pendulispora albinea]|uniref:HAMP domain-containing histidine kinase n=1 Tax=Pendulispora albinea TaxID=2741071 RepID=A0ABZ2LVP6_9BACT